MIVDKPVQGFYRARRSAKHPWSPVLIFTPCPIDPDHGYPLDRPRLLSAIINGKPVSPLYIWSWCAGNPISAAEFRYLTHVAAMPGQPEATPHKPIDLNSLPPLYQRRNTA